jgi:hypothetical protein
MAAASEAGTIEGRSVGQWVEEIDDSQETESETTSDRRNYPSKGNIHHFEFSFHFTDI